MKKKFKHGGLVPPTSKSNHYISREGELCLNPEVISGVFKVMGLKNPYEFLYIHSFHMG